MHYNFFLLAPLYVFLSTLTLSSAAVVSRRGDTPSGSTHVHHPMCNAMVFKPSTLHEDVPENRHVALYFTFIPGSTEGWLVHIVNSGGEGAFKTDHKKEKAPEYKTKTADVEIGRLLKPASEKKVMDIVNSVKVKPPTDGYNCQHFVHEVLEALQKKGLLSKEQVDKGYDAVLDKVYQKK